MSMIDEDLSVSEDDFDDLFPTPEDTKPSEFDELVTVIGKDEAPAEKPAKKRGRPAAKKAAEKKNEEETPVEPAPKKRGRPGRKAVAVVEEAPVVEKEEEPAVPVKKTRSKRVSVDDFPPEVLERIFEEYSQRPAAEFAKELDIPEKYLHKAIARMKELFEMSISTGDLTQEDYEEIVAPKLQEYQEPKDGFEVFVQKKLKKLKK